MKQICIDYLAEQLGDRDVAAEVYAEYATSFRKKLAEAQESYAARDWKNLDFAVHTLKGNALSAGDKEAAELAIELRGAATLADEEKARSLLSRLAAMATEL